MEHVLLLLAVLAGVIVMELLRMDVRPILSMGTPIIAVDAELSALEWPMGSQDVLPPLAEWVLAMQTGATATTHQEMAVRASCSVTPTIVDHARFLVPVTTWPLVLVVRDNVWELVLQDGQTVMATNSAMDVNVLSLCVGPTKL
jgi:hypothetical protein